MTDEKPITVWISKKIHEKLKKVSRKTGRTQKSLIQESLAEFIKNIKKDFTM